MALMDVAGHLERIGAGELEDADAGGGLAADLAPLVVDLGAQLDPGHVLDAGQPHPGGPSSTVLTMMLPNSFGVAQAGPAS